VPGKRLDGNGGSDAIYAANGYRDTITCTGRHDRVIADPFDTVTKSCALITRKSLATTTSSPTS